MNIAITTEAENLLIDGKVRKPNGSKIYTLKDRIVIHGGPTINADEDTLFLVCEDSINCISSQTKLSIDFDHLEDARQFLDDLIYDEEERNSQ